ncbi:hypothetical protein C6W92_06030 [Roseovarius sp. A46]|uniref:phage tail assembly chaperone n=1 Tax=Roseovarius sp. A46 TaxID=2109331 RepID=UPI001013679F|nr:hypothetical protein [Roseovarius sp. A46]RXV64856.1 hypothetical protein C6W92_06030 [Roseovarius sp. A46]
MRDELYTTQLCEAVASKLQGKEPRLPAGSAILWRAFADLSRARTWNSFGPTPISFSEIEAWCRLTRTPLARRHVQIIEAMDGALLEHYSRSKADNHPDGVKTIQRGSRHALSPALFDAVMG